MGLGYDVSTFLLIICVLVSPCACGVWRDFRRRATADDSRSTGAYAAAWLTFGVLWGLLALSNPSLLLFLPACGLWVMWVLSPPRPAGRLCIRRRAGLHPILPWVITAANGLSSLYSHARKFWSELYLGNGPGAMGFLMEYNHPYEAPDQLTDSITKWAKWPMRRCVAD